VDARSALRLLESLYRAALRAVEPEGLVRRCLASPELCRAVAEARATGLFAVGKAAAGMAAGALARVDPRDGLVVLPEGYAAPRDIRRFAVFASHPEPSAASVRAARRARGFFAGFGAGDVILCLVSGGASSLLALPREGLTLEQKRRAVADLTRSGASILAVNRLRTSLSAIKGGRLGRMTHARLITLVLSDVPGDRAAVVGSGPTVRGRRGDVVRVIGSNRTGLDAAALEAQRRGFAVRRADERLSGEASSAGRRLARRLRALPPRTLFLSGGETVVTLGPRAGRGGRSLEVALSAALALEGGPETVLLAAGSDGRDGSSTAAGAFAGDTTASLGRERGLDPKAALSLHDTHPFFDRLGLLLRTGPTGTNVGDWVFGIRGAGDRVTQ